MSKILIKCKSITKLSLKMLKRYTIQILPKRKLLRFIGIKVNFSTKKSLLEIKTLKGKRYPPEVSIYIKSQDP